MKVKYMKLNKLIRLILFPLITICALNLFSISVYADANLEQSENCDTKTIYLTFDDGPAGKITTSILDVLKENQVHATFFFNR